MLAVTMAHADASDPLTGLRVGEHPGPAPDDDGWSVVDVKAASLNHHDIWSLRGHGPKQAPLPRVLGSDGAGVDETGRDVVIHALVNDPDWSGEEVLDPRVSMLSD